MKIFQQEVQRRIFITPKFLLLSCDRQKSEFEWVLTQVREKFEFPASYAAPAKVSAGEDKLVKL